MSKRSETSKKLILWIDKEIKEKGDEIIYNLGLKPATVINLMYRQIINQREIPFKITMPDILLSPNPNITRR